MGTFDDPKDIGSMASNVLTNDPSLVRHFVSPVFGPIRDATDEEQKLISRMAVECPAALFGAINKQMNSRGLCISTAVLGQTLITLPQ